MLQPTKTIIDYTIIFWNSSFYPVPSVNPTGKYSVVSQCMDFNKIVSFPRLWRKGSIPCTFSSLPPLLPHLLSCCQSLPLLMPSYLIKATWNKRKWQHLEQSSQSSATLSYSAVQSQSPTCLYCSPMITWSTNIAHHFNKIVEMARVILISKKNLIKEKKTANIPHCNK